MALQIYLLCVFAANVWVVGAHFGGIYASHPVSHVGFFVLMAVVVAALQITLLKQWLT